VVGSDRVRRAFAEFVGTGLLVAVVIGSGIMAAQLSPGDVGLELAENAAATAAGLAVIILLVGPVSGAHLNPVVSLVDWALGGRRGGRDLAAYVAAQVTGGIGGAVLANLMFALPPVTISQHDRTGGHLWLGEVVATAGLVALVFALARSGRAHLGAAAVGAYIGAAYWFTSATSFANPAVTIARGLSDSFAGIAPASVPPFVLAQLVGAALGGGLVLALYPSTQGVTVSEVLFVCVHNAGRSQMAAALLQHHAQGRVTVRSAGSAPTESINPAVVEVMAELGMDLSREFPKPLTDDGVRAADVVITMGCGDACPVYPGKRYLDWKLDDPAGKPVDQVRPIRDEIDRRVRALLIELSADR
jgi:arsenate reductase